MGKKDDIKIRVLAVEKILMRKKLLSVNKIKDELERIYDITADRRTIYSDIYAIDRFTPIECVHGRNGGFRVFDPYARVDGEEDDERT